MTKLTKKLLIDLWSRRREGDDVLFYSLDDHQFILKAEDEHGYILAYRSPEGKTIAVRGGWAHDITNML